MIIDLDSYKDIYKIMKCHYISNRNSESLYKICIQLMEITARNLSLLQFLKWQRVEGWSMLQL